MYKFISQVEIAEKLSGGRNSRRRLSDVDKIVLHRLGPQVGTKLVHDGLSMVGEFMKTGKYQAGSYTGGKIPYHLIYHPETMTAYQVLPFTKTAIHAGKHNKSSIGIAVLRDLRTDPLMDEQADAFYDLVTAMSDTLSWVNGKDPQIVGHDQLNGGSKDPDKECPGRLLDIGVVNARVAARSKIHA